MEYLELNNFRCFEHLPVTFTPGVNLLIGDNASGKTSLLMGCKYAANCFFSGFSDNYTSWTTPHKDDFMQSYAGEKRLQPKPIDIAFRYFEQEMPEAGWNKSPLFRLYKKNGKNSKPWQSYLQELKRYGAFLRDNQIVSADSGEYVQRYALPLIASFSTHGIHNTPRIESKYFYEYSQTPSFGYYMCHATDGLLEHWIRRMLVLTEAGKNTEERAVVTEALKRMFGDDGCALMTGFDVRVNFGDIFCIFNDGREIPVSILSDGYKRLFSIVIDLAFRCAQLNSMKYGVDAALLTTGTVIIDEIDLHLHPSLQAVVLKALQHTFPKLQFIVSTHAPMVMSGVESNGRNCVQFIKYNSDTGAYEMSRVETFGMDLSTLAEAVLKVPKRDISVECELNHLSEMMDMEDYVAAKKLLAELKQRFGSRIPELSAFETQLTFEESLR